MTYPLSTLRTFEAAARLLSFTKAADELHMTQSAVSQQIKQLEERLGFNVFRRLTRRLELTNQGLQLYETVRRSIYELDNMVEALRDDTVKGNVVISTGSAFATNWLIPKLGRFRQSYPDIELSIQPSDNTPDLNKQSSIDVAVRFGGFSGENMQVMDIIREQVFVVGSPELLGNDYPLKAIADLSRYTLIHNDVSETEPDSAADWNSWLSAINIRTNLDLSTGPRYPRSDLVVQSAVHGEGLALAWETMVKNELNDGQLIKAFGGLFETHNHYVAWCTPNNYRKSKVKVLLQWLQLEAQC